MNTANTNLYPCLWVKDNAREHFDYYAGIFNSSSLDDENQFVVYGKLDNTPIMLLNGNPNYQPNGSMSFMVMSKDPGETIRLHEKLKEGGAELMPLDKYDWSSLYSWVVDKYGISWQLYTEDQTGTSSKRIVPTLMFCGAQQGNCMEALKMYERIFPDFKSDGVMYYPEGDRKDQVMHTQFYLNGEMLMAMDSGVDQPFTFNQTFSFVVECDDQQTIDHYWNNLLKDGTPSKCGWLSDKFNFSWQIVPKNIGELLFDGINAQTNFNKMLTMTKIEVDQFE